MEQAKSVPERTHGISRMAVAMDVGLSLASVDCVLNDDPNSHASSFCHHPSAALEI
jgi:hypothetical protein